MGKLQDSEAETRTDTNMNKRTMSLKFVFINSLVLSDSSGNPKTLQIYSDMAITFFTSSAPHNDS